MDPFEEQLKNALRREPPRTGFALRVRARVAHHEQTTSSAAWTWFPRWRWVLAILLCIAMVAGAWYRREKVERARGEAAKQQVFVALRLAGAKMQFAESKVRHFQE